MCNKLEESRNNALIFSAHEECYWILQKEETKLCKEIMRNKMGNSSNKLNSFKSHEACLEGPSFSELACNKEKLNRDLEKAIKQRKEGRSDLVDVASKLSEHRMTQ